MTTKRYDHILAAVQRHPWAILPEKLDLIAEVLELRANGKEFTPEEIAARVGTERPPAEAPPGSLVAVLPVMGTIVNRGDMFTEASGMTTCEGLTRKLQALANEQSIGTIVMDMDSPGGQVSGIPELAEEIFRVRKQKRIVAHVNALSASAAYWLASQADEIVATPSAMVGSIGVLHVHVERSKQLEEEGLGVTVSRIPKFKAEGNSFEPLTDEAREHIEATMKAFYDMFTKGVAKGRGISASVVRKDFGEGRVVLAHQALELGMIDRVESASAMFARVTKETAKNKGNMPRAESESVSLEAEPRNRLSADDDVETVAIEHEHRMRKLDLRAR